MNKLSSEEVQQLIDEALNRAPKPKSHGKKKRTDPPPDSPKPDWLNKCIKGKG
jgi:hypothetical protein